MKELKQNREHKAANGYGSFVKSSMMLNKDGCDSDSDAEIISPVKYIPATTVLSDEALFAACGGRTAHK